jgi:hypothetical protein
MSQLCKINSKWIKGSQHWWLIPIIPATQEAEIRKMEVGSQPRQIVLETKKAEWSQAPVSHTWNPRYSGGRDQEDRGSKSAQANSFMRPVSTKPITKKG